MFNGFPIPKPEDKKGSNIKSIQRVTGIIPAWTAGAIVNINNVNLVNSIVIGFFDSPHLAPTGTLARFRFESNNQVRVQSGAAFGQEGVYSFQVIEFENVKSIQSGEINPARNTFVTIGINPIVMNKSILVASAWFASTQNAASYYAEITTPVEIKVRGSVIDSALGIHWQVVEFK